MSQPTQTQTLLAAVKKRQGLKSDYALAMALGISTQRCYGYVKGEYEIGDQDLLVKAAELAGWAPLNTMVNFLASKARTQRMKGYFDQLQKLIDEADTKARKAGKKVGAIATAALVSGMAFFGAPQPAEASRIPPAAVTSAPDVLYNAHSYARRRRRPWWRWLFWFPARGPGLDLVAAAV